MRGLRTTLLVIGLCQVASSFDCEGLPPRNETVSDEKVKPLIQTHEWIKPSLEVLFGALPGSSIGLFLLDKFLSNAAAGSTPSAWDQVKEKVEAAIRSHVDEVRKDALCKDLTKYRKRIDMCSKDKSVAQSMCLKSLFDEMAGNEAHFKFDQGREIALSLPLYTMYTVMTLAVGNMFMKQNKDFPIEGAATLEKIQPAAREFSAYVNQSIPKALKWRKSEIGYYTRYIYNEASSSYNEDGKGRFDENGNAIADNKKRSFAFDQPSHIGFRKDWRFAYKPKLAHNKSRSHLHRRRLMLNGKNFWLKLVVTDKVNQTTVSEVEEKRYVFFENMKTMFNDLLAKAWKNVTKSRDAAESELRSLYGRGIQSITNEYWRIYDRGDFGSIDLEKSNKNWLEKFPTQPSDV